MARDLLIQVELLEAACHRALNSEEDPATRDALVRAVAGYVVVPDDRSPIERPYVRGLANMARVHAEHLAHRLKTETDDTAGRRSLRVALEQVCHSLADLHQALVEGDDADLAAASSESPRRPELVSNSGSSAPDRGRGT